MQTVNDLITDAILQAGIIPQEGGPYGSLPDYMVQQAFLLLNDIINEWGGNTAIIPYNNKPLKFDFVPNQENYTFGPSPEYFMNTQSIIDIITFSFFLDAPSSKVNIAIQRMNEFEYSNILYRNWNCYPSTYLLRDYPNYSEIIVQPLPSQAYAATIICKQRIPPLPSIQSGGLFKDLSSDFPPNFLLCLKYRLILDIYDSYGMTASQSFLSKYEKSMNALQASNKLDLTLQPSQWMSSRRGGYGNYFFGMTGL